MRYAFSSPSRADIRRHFVTLSLVVWWTAAALALASCAGSAPKSTTSSEQSDEEIDKKLRDKLEKGITLVESGRFQEAITLYFDPIISEMESLHNEPNVRYYCASTQPLVLVYMLKHASEAQKGEIKDSKTDAAAVSWVWSEAHYLKSYALLELSELDKAQKELEAALYLSPLESRYLSELGYVHQLKKDWKTSYDYFEEALGCAEFHEGREGVTESTRALRGMGYCLVEMGQLDDASKMYEKALQIDPSDDKSKAELMFIGEQKSKSQQNGQ